MSNPEKLLSAIQRGEVVATTDLKVPPNLALTMARQDGFVVIDGQRIPLWWLRRDGGRHCPEEYRPLLDQASVPLHRPKPMKSSDEIRATPSPT